MRNFWRELPYALLLGSIYAAVYLAAKAVKYIFGL